MVERSQEKHFFPANKKLIISLDLHRQEPNQRQDQEKVKLKTNLSKHEARVCGLCYKKEHFEYEEGVQFRECDNCELWVHTYCDLLIDELNENKYQCPPCRSKQ